MSCSVLLNSREDLPQAVKDILDEQVASDSKCATKALHKLVASQATARRQVQEIQNKRRDYLQQWPGYLGQLGTLWESQLKDKAQFLDSLDSAESSWSHQLAEATAAISRTVSEQPDALEKKEVEDMEVMEAQVAEDASQDAQRRAARELQQQQEAQISEQFKLAKQAIDQQVSHGYRDASRSPRGRAPTLPPTYVCDSDEDKLRRTGGTSSVPPQAS